MGDLEPFSPSLSKIGVFLRKNEKSISFIIWVWKWVGENNNCSPVSGPFSQMFIIEKCIFRICFDFSSGANLSGCALVILEF